MSTNNCRKCGAPIIWKTNTKTKKAAPLDIAPTNEGNIALVGERNYTVLTKEDLDRAGQALLYTNHFATCPEAGHFRRDISRDDATMGEIAADTLDAAMATRDKRLFEGTDLTNPGFDDQTDSDGKPWETSPIDPATLDEYAVELAKHRDTPLGEYPPIDERGPLASCNTPGKIPGAGTDPDVVLYCNRPRHHPGNHQVTIDWPADPKDTA